MTFAAARIVEIFAWLTLVSGVLILPIWFVVQGVPADADMRLGAIVATVLNGVIGWAVLLLIGRTAERVEELGRKLDRKDE